MATEPQSVGMSHVTVVPENFEGETARDAESAAADTE